MSINKGTVTISLDDFKYLERQNYHLEDLVKKYKVASEELSSFLSYLKKNIDGLQDHIDKFNKQSNTSYITEYGEGGKLKIIINRETENDKV